jgi:hypothetical protein
MITTDLATRTHQHLAFLIPFFTSTTTTSNRPHNNIIIIPSHQRNVSPRTSFLASCNPATKPQHIQQLRFYTSMPKKGVLFTAILHGHLNSSNLRWTEAPIRRPDSPMPLNASTVTSLNKNEPAYVTANGGPTSNASSQSI